MRFVAHSNHSRIGLGDTASLVFIFGYTVNDRAFFVAVTGHLSWSVDGTNDVHLVILPRLVVMIDVDDVVGVVDPEDGVAGVPVDVMDVLHSSDMSGSVGQDVDQQMPADDKNGLNFGVAAGSRFWLAGHFQFMLFYDILVAAIMESFLQKRWGKRNELVNEVLSTAT